MTNTGVNSHVAGAVFDRNSRAGSMMPGVAKAENNAADFGAVFDKAAWNADQLVNSGIKDSATKAVSAGKKAAESARQQNTTQRKTENAADTKAQTAEKNVTTTETPQEEGVVDEATAEQITDALQQMFSQLMELLGVTEEELLNGMEAADLQPLDLLNPANMPQLLTALTGKDSVISLVADEELYTALQEITAMVDTQVGDLLEAAGLSEEELQSVLQKLQKQQEGEVSISTENVSETDMAQFDLPLKTTEDAQSSQTEPVIVKEDNTQSNDTMQEVSDSQQQNQPETNTKAQSSQTEEDGKENSGQKEFGQHQNLAQNLSANTVDTTNAVSEAVNHYTSENTENIMRQLADMVRIIKGENMTEMEMQLHPASLGTVNVSLTTKGGMVTAEFTTQNEAVKAVIEAQASQLRANLEEQGVKIEAIEVTVESHQMERDLEKDGQGQQQAEEQRAQHVQGMRRRSINLSAFEDAGELAQEMQGADDATRIAMEIMSANGNTMDLLV